MVAQLSKFANHLCTGHASRMSIVTPAPIKPQQGYFESGAVSCSCVFLNSLLPSLALALLELQGRKWVPGPFHEGYGNKDHPDGHFLSHLERGPWQFKCTHPGSTKTGFSISKPSPDERPHRSPVLAGLERRHSPQGLPQPHSTCRPAPSLPHCPVPSPVWEGALDGGVLGSGVAEGC